MGQPQSSATISPIAQWVDVDAQVFNEVIRPRGRPAIMKGLVKAWPAVAAAQQSDSCFAAYLADFQTGPEIPFFEATPASAGRFVYNERVDGFDFERKSASFDHFIDRVLHAGSIDDPTLYAGSLSIPGYFTAFARDNSLAGTIRGSPVLNSIWIGNRTRIAPHYDNTENIACVVAGQRRFTLFPIEAYADLYVGPLDLTPAGQPISMVDGQHPDFSRYPRYREALAVAEQATLEAGDAIYIPTLWWHGVEALSPFNVLVNYWWRDVPGYFGSPADSLLHCLLTLRDLPVAQRARWKAVFDHLIFETSGPAFDHLPEAARGIFGELTPERAALIRRFLVDRLAS